MDSKAGYCPGACDAYSTPAMVRSPQRKGKGSSICVIMYATATLNTRPTEQMVEKAFAANEDGAGIAYREGDEVVWEKGLNYERVSHLCRVLPLPYVAHFRRASQNGGGIKPALTHPFLVDETALPDLKGRTKGHVFFHNGDWTGWDEAGRRVAETTQVEIPDGPWSDSRAMAWLFAVKGFGYMNFLPLQKGIAFGPHDEKIMSGKGWVKVNDVWCSNDAFLYHKQWSNLRMCKFGSCTRSDTDAEGFCKDHQLAPIKGPEVSQLPAAPFSLTAPKAIIPLAMAERLYTEKKISKNLIKGLRKAHERLALGGKQAEKARRGLEIASRLPCFNGLLP